MCGNRFVTFVLISVWTIVQTLFHLAWTLYGYSFYFCHFIPTHFGMVFTYLTYFYHHKCGKILLDPLETDFVLLNTNLYGFTKINTSQLHNFIDDVLQKALLPEEAYYAGRTQIYFLMFIVTDALWIFTALLLLIGTFFQTKNCLAVLLCGPWLMVTASVSILDVVAAVQYGFDIRYLKNITSWLKFVGVKNYDEFSEYDNIEGFSDLLPIFPATIICVLSARLLIFWILNLMAFFYILNSMMVSFQLKYKSQSTQNRRQPSINSSIRKNLNSSEDRIRNWQLFYGATDTTSSNETIESNETDCNSNSRKNKINKRSGEDQSPSPTPPSAINRIIVSSLRDERPDNPATYVNTSFYHQYSDVAEDIDMVEVRPPSPMKVLRSQLPWSYVHGYGNRLNESSRRFNRVREESVTNL